MTQLDQHTLLPVVASAIADEWAALRDETPGPDPFAWDGDTRIGGEDLPADSLALVRLATRIGQMFHLEEAGAGDNLLRFRTLGDWAEMAATGVAEVGKITFLTSGTTGDPKPRTHHLEWLEQEAAFLAGYFRRTAPGRRRVYALAPPHHIYGFLFGVLLPRALDLPVLPAGHPAQWQPGRLEPGDLVVGFPAVWQHLAERVPTLPGNLHGVTSTAPCPPELHRRLLEQGLAGLTEVFGSSETAGVGLRENPEAPFELMPHWIPGEPGELVRRTPEGGAAAVAFDTDHIQWQTPRRFYPQGRADGVVQVGGLNVDPVAVARRLEEHPAVAAAEVARDPGLDRLVAWITPLSDDTEDSTALRDDLEQWATSLSPPERPIRFHLTSGPSPAPTGAP